MTGLAEIAEVVRGRVVVDGAVSVDAVSVDDVSVDDVYADSRQVRPGALFCCVPGRRTDGHDHARDAVEAGAVALLCERPLQVDVPQVVVEEVRRAMGPAAALVHGHPADSLDLVGVTGTNGKTTVVAMVESILRAAGRSARAIGTLTGARTTPEAPDLQRQLRRFVDEGVDSVAMEVSSHALAMHRVDGMVFDVAAFTNLGVDHLDFHGTPEAYFTAKARLFDEDVSRAGVVNVDDVHGRLLLDASGGRCTGVSLDDTTDLRTGRDGTTLTWRGLRLRIPLPGRHNATNALLAAQTCRVLGIDDDAIVQGLAELPVVPGRFETFVAPSGTTVVVDYAHTPDALESVLRAARSIGDPSTRLTVVFGCGGDRDRGKRPLMGSVAADLADRVVITTDNPRSEDPAAIAAEVRAGALAARSEDREHPAVVEEVPDRAEAIRRAVQEAGPHDVVVIAGKGHEQGQEFRDRVEPFDDAEVVRSVISPAEGAADR